MFLSVTGRAGCGKKGKKYTDQQIFHSRIFLMSSLRNHSALNGWMGIQLLTVFLTKYGELHPSTSRRMTQPGRCHFQLSREGALGGYNYSMPCRDTA
jgi:hypothetical protein